MDRLSFRARLNAASGIKLIYFRKAYGEYRELFFLRKHKIVYRFSGGSINIHKIDLSFLADFIIQLQVLRLNAFAEA